MDNLSKKFPSICNSDFKKEIDIKLYYETPYREIARWLKEVTDCKEDCISASTIGRYNKYVLEHGGFEQLVDSDDIDDRDITFEELEQKTINLLYHRLDDLSGGNFVQACATILKVSRPTNLNVTADRCKT